MSTKNENKKTGEMLAWKVEQMAGVKRRIKRNQRKTNPDFYVSAWSEDGNISVVIRAGGWISGTGMGDTGLPDGNLPWLVEKIVARIERGPCRNQEEALCIADQVIQDQKPALLALAYPWNEGSVSKRQHKGIGALC